MKILGVVVLLTGLLAIDICKALKVIVTPGPVVEFTEGQRGTLFCRISQQKRRNSYLSLVWLFSNSLYDNQRILRLNRTGHVQAFRNCRERRCELQFFEQGLAKVYVLIINKFHNSDEGRYRCKVQEIANLNRRWLSISNGDNATEVRDPVLETSTILISKNPKEGRTIFGDLYLYVTLVCSLGIISMMLFAAIIICQTLKNRKKTKGRKYLTKGPNSSSGETVMSTGSTSLLQPKSEKKKIVVQDPPPPIPVKSPTRNTSNKKKFLKKQDAKSILPRIVEDSLTYAELELVPTQPSAPSNPTTANSQGPTTVYAKILFSENQDQ
ncbi:V-set and transmembrane domain-containing protein 4a isoform X2 [Hemiscyllium ocellatum]|uniref:V-set and transmembrane domain-containing protein 4a isoform X2 n=1 Tax=Hemiscyllium ocellatum TaxID=170820 RepID=UPI00296693F5|nr:V-set and transmembrane domain-containing protein 4a isoform X2 [Hemiscyllium ocellatum]